MSEKGQNEIASGIYRAFKEYKFQMEQDDLQSISEKNRLDSIMAVEEKAIKEVESLDTLANNTLIFGVQFLTSKGVFKNGSKELKGLKDVWLYNDSNYNKYVSGKFKDIEKANAHARKVRESGFSDAFVVAFLNGERIPKRKALKMLDK